MRFVVQASKRAGAPTLVVDGKALHSTYDPVKEAERVASVLREGTRLACVLGPGLGYLVEAAAARAGEVLTVCADAELLAFVENRRAAENRPLPGRAIPATADVDQWEEVLAKVPGLATGRAVLLEGCFEPGREAAYAAAQENFTKALDRIVERTLTLNAFGPLYLENFLRNLRAGADRFLDPASLADRLAGRSVVLAAPGPTLETALADLAEARRAPADRRVPLWAVDSAAAKLLRSGIRPDLVFTLDPQRHVGRMLGRAADLPVVGLPTACPEALAAGRATYLFGQGYPLESALPTPLFIPGDGDFGGSVSSFAACAAEWAGAAETILVGQDFGYPVGREYAPGGVMEDFSLERVDRFAALETIRRRTAPGVEVETIGGAKVPTRRNLLSYLAAFVAIAKRMRIVQTDPRSGKIEGATHRSLASALADAKRPASDARAEREAGPLWRADDVEEILDRLARLPRSEYERAGTTREAYLAARAADRA